MFFKTALLVSVLCIGVAHAQTQISAKERKKQCAALAQRVKNLDEQARRGLTAAQSNYNREERRNARSKQSNLGCCTRHGLAC